MLFIWQKIVIIMMIISLVGNVSIMNLSTLSTDWRIVETIAEEVPYIVALLSKKKSYICTGVAISRDAVLTTGKCINLNPEYVVIGQAVINNYISKNKFMKIAKFIQHPDYTFVWETEDTDKTTVHSNIGVVYTVKKILNLYYDMAQIGAYFALELHDKQFSTVGYGNSSIENTQVLNRHFYYQETCLNPKWYYCVCGFTSEHIRLDEVFGEGGPLLLNTDVVAVASAPCGELNKPSGIVSYNIFTVIGPYLTWMNRLRDNTHKVKFSKSCGGRIVNPFSMIMYVLSLITSKSFL